MDSYLDQDGGRLFHHRRDAGQQLGLYLKKNYHFPLPLVLALPRGGVEVGLEVARELNCPFNVIIARKIGAPGDKEFGIGAVSEDGVAHFNPDWENFFNYDSTEVQQTIREEISELHRRIQLYRKGAPLVEIAGKNVILVDDGLATGATALAAAWYLRQFKPASILLAVPVGPAKTSARISAAVDEVVCLYRRRELKSIGLWYEDFSQVSDEKVISLLRMEQDEWRI